MAQNGCVKREINVYLAYGNVIKRRIVLMALTRKIVVSGDRDGRRRGWKCDANNYCPNLMVIKLF